MRWKIPFFDSLNPPQKGDFLLFVTVKCLFVTTVLKKIKKYYIIEKNNIFKTGGK